MRLLARFVGWIGLLWQTCWLATHADNASFDPIAWLLLWLGLALGHSFLPEPPAGWLGRPSGIATVSGAIYMMAGFLASQKYHNLVEAPLWITGAVFIGPVLFLGGWIFAGAPTPGDATKSPYEGVEDVLASLKVQGQRAAVPVAISSTAAAAPVSPADWLARGSRPSSVIVGESHYTASFRKLTKGKLNRKPRVLVPVTVTLARDWGNRYDSNAVAATIDGLQVGYIARETAAILRMSGPATLPGVIQAFTDGKGSRGFAVLVWPEGCSDQGLVPALSSSDLRGRWDPEDSEIVMQ